MKEGNWTSDTQPDWDYDLDYDEDEELCGAIGEPCCDYVTATCQEGTCVNGVCYAPKHRYISIRSNPEQVPNSARRVKLDTGETLGWVGAPYENLGLTLADVVSSPKYSDADFPGEWPEVVHVIGCEIATGQTYMVQAVQMGLDIGNEGMYSEALLLHTPSTWGDTVSTCAGNVCKPPNGVVGLDDVQAAIKLYQGTPVAPLTWLDIHPSNLDQVPDQTVGIGDILKVIDGFQGKPYPGDGPLDCP